jgi:hypothetical protein
VARPKEPHPLGKVSAGARLDIPMPDQLHRRLMILAALQGISPTTWARDALERVIEGEFAFTKRRFPQLGGQDNTGNAQ